MPVSRKINRTADRTVIMQNEPVEPREILAEYDIGVLSQVTAAGGTAGRTWKIDTSTGTYFLRLRGVRTSGDRRLRFDHGLRRRLVARGVPTASAVPTRAGDLWVRRHGRVYELYPFVYGRTFCPTSEKEIANAARALAAYHRAAAEFVPPSPSEEAIAQYTTLEFSNEVSDRMDDPRLLAVNMHGVRDLAGTGRERELVDRCLARVEGMAQSYAGNIYEKLAGWIIHGDYTPANLLFSKNGEVVGIFDLDWAVPGPRCRDVADGLYFFSVKPRQIDSEDIWSLTDAAELDMDRCLVFLNAYLEAAPLSPYEIDAMPSALAGRWFSIRLEGMAKVQEDDRFRFFSRDIERPLRWMDANWADLREAIC